jgi:cation/acetate symporter
LRSVFGVEQPIDLWWGIQPISAGLFGVPVGFAVIVLVSLLWPSRDLSVNAMIDDWRQP